MIEPVIFWAQALDNSAPDHIEMRGVELSADDAVGRRGAVSLVSQTVKSGNRIFEAQGVRLTADDQHFVAQVPSVQRDRAGRTAPIICYGDYDQNVENVLGTSVADGLAKFAKRIGRSIQAEHLELVNESFASLKWKLSKNTLVLQAAIGTVTLALIFLGFWLASRRS